MRGARFSAWLPAACLAFSAFVFNTSEFAPVALLSNIAASFEMRVADTGLMLTIYAWVVALVSLPFMLLFSTLERRRLLLGVMSLFVVSHVLSAVAWSFEVLLLSRLGVAMAHAVFWAITAAITMRVAPPGKQTQALSLLVSGSALAVILGLPLGRIVGEWISWRLTFLLIGAVATVMLLVAYRQIPPLPSTNAGSLKNLPSLLQRPALIGLYVLVMLIVTAHFTAYSYIEPLVQETLGFGEHFATVILFVYGLAGLVASTQFSRLYASFPLGVLFGAVGLITLSMLLLLPWGGSRYTTLLICAAWGVGITLMTLAAQVGVLKLAADATDVGTAIFSGIYNVGIGGGALVGSLVILHSGLSRVGYAGAAIGLLALVWGLGFCLHFMRRSAITEARRAEAAGPLLKPKPQAGLTTSD
ncbi:sugar transporter [Microbulbifer thermotolerans]|uniref:Sugar transporter n=1 Tax=Microbulbifer thermotolerans TaxID=252514 RepID=A0AB35HSQ6_MICTH|nr:sugar transporter [Microbulbifer thermotolerans]MCX2779113.1 sugar transporter [Microbulbifer thermotolerans]MCX2795645.1 sugar transporter [Microbulbifer thermotolerans]MCX2800169.1 sugar transporter [Microbulbifer thermotolerans]MCX2805255.1 sugar transporter [Microbulbifer thermotolerans]MCX2831770.1 sugar transporter [Microbulbifer thermotolerans]